MFLAMLDWTQCAAVERVPGKVSGARVFGATRVPVRALFENLEDGATVNESYGGNIIQGLEGV